MYNPHSTKYNYPEYTDQHYLVVKKNNGLVFDENYPYIDNSKGFRFKRWWVRVLLYLIVFPLSIPYMGLRIKGRKNLKKYKDELKNGAITVSNHVHMWDYIAIMKALRPRETRVLVWAPNIRGESGTLARLVGGVPIPDGNLGGKVASNKAVEQYVKEGGILQIYAEGSMWECYPYIRPFHTGAFSLACRLNKPVLPIGFSFRKPSWIRRHIFKQEVAITLKIGEPLYKDEALSEGEQRIDLTKRCHHAVCLLSDVDPKENPYEEIFNKTKKLDI